VAVIVACFGRVARGDLPRRSLMLICVQASTSAKWAVAGKHRVMTSRISQITLDVADVAAMADFWSAVLGYTVEDG
jgi:catechol-2,3-dioxygenase